MHRQIRVRHPMHNFSIPAVLKVWMPRSFEVAVRFGTVWKDQKALIPFFSKWVSCEIVLSYSLPRTGCFILPSNEMKTASAAFEAAAQQNPTRPRSISERSHPEIGANIHFAIQSLGPEWAIMLKVTPIMWRVKA